jgi:transcriptional regulator with XRE-family HTH domain
MQENYFEKLGARIKGLRKEKKLTLSALCYKNGLEPSTVSRVEKAKVDVKLSTLLKITEALEIDLSDLVNSL